MEKMENWREVQKEKGSIADRMDFFVRNNQDMGDVSFAVGSGSQVETIKAFKLILVAQSPVFERLFKESWSKSPGRIEAIPDVQPYIFRHFLKLLLKDQLRTETLTSLNLTIDEALQLLYVGKKYEVPAIEKACQEFIRNNTTKDNALFVYKTIESLNENKLADETFNFVTKNVADIFEREEFLEMSHQTLSQLLSHDDLPMDELSLFDSVCRWAEYQCAKQGLPKSGENLRKILGELLYKIRFPLIPVRDFALAVRSRNILKPEEVLALYDYVCSPENLRNAINVEHLGFSTRKRSGKYAGIVSFSDGVDSPSYIPGLEQFMDIQSPKKISIKSFGFLGPIHGDSSFQATIRIGVGASGLMASPRSTTRTVWAKNRTIFHVPFDSPVVIEPCSWYRLYYTLSGAAMQSTIHDRGNKTVTNEGITFSFYYYGNGPLSEIRYENLETESDRTKPSPHANGSLEAYCKNHQQSMSSANSIFLLRKPDIN